MRTAFLSSFVGPARHRPQIWRLLLGVLLSVLVYLVWSVGLLAAVWWGTSGRFDPAWIQTVSSADTPMAMLVVLATFGGMMLGPALAVRLLHRRRAATLFGPATRVLRDFVTASTVVGILLALSVAVWSVVYDATPNLPLGTWAALLPVALLGVLVQTGAEEVLFRGYILQQLAARFRSPLVWMVLPSVLFGMVHFDPVTSGRNVWLVVASAGLFGLLAADLVARTGSLGAAWGFHFANNVVALLFVATDGTLTGLSLYLTPYGADDAVELGPLIPIDLGVMLLAWLVLRRLLHR